MAVSANGNRVLKPLAETPSLSARVYEAIKDAILSLDIRPGELLAIGRLAEQLGTSRTPVRDALLVLEREGLVTIRPQKGAYVSPISATDVEEIYELRIVLESYAARLAAARVKAEELDRIEAALEAARRAFAQGQEIVAADLGRGVHDLLVSKVGSRRFAGALNDLETHYTRIRHFAAILPDRFDRSYQEHRVILAALRAGDGESAARAMADHLASVRADVLANRDVWMDRLGNGGVIISPQRDHAAREAPAAARAIGVGSVTDGSRPDRVPVGNVLP